MAVAATHTQASARDLRAAVAALRRSELVVYPTETLYGLGADALDSVALERLFAVKRREADKPVALIAADLAIARLAVAEFSPAAARLAERYWPGPLTLVLPALPTLHPGLVGELGVGIRVSSHPVARYLSAELGRPITATSANPAGASPPIEISTAREYFGDKVRVYLDGGRLGHEAVSSIVALEGATIKIIREGAIASSDIRAALC